MMELFQKLSILFLAAAASLHADVNVLIIGSDSSGDRFYERSLYGAGNEGTPPFLFEEVADHLREILEGASHGAVNVSTRNIAVGDASSPVASSNLSRTYSSNLLSWFYWPYAEWKGSAGGTFYSNVTDTEHDRWANLRGEGDTEWDYVVLIGDPSTIERMPGFYTLGVSKIAEEVAKGDGEAVLLMPWPAPGSDATLDHYKEVVYRTGRTAGIPVAPAGLAWQAAGAPAGGSHPSADGAYIAAAALYSRLFGASAATSSYNYNTTLANTAHTTILANQGAPQYSGPFEFISPLKAGNDKRRNILHSNRGTSSENRFRRAFTDALGENRITHSSTRETYNSDTPDDDGLGWPFSGSQLPISLNWGRHWSFAGDGPWKSYFTNTDFWELGFGFAYQNTDDSTQARALMAGRDFYIGYLMGEGTVRPTTPQTDPKEREDEINTARLIPVHVLYAQIQRESPTNTFKSDQSHLSRAIDVAAANLMGTMYSGRCLVPGITTGDGNLPDPVLKRIGQKVGYETAWIVGKLQARAPGFRALPSSSDTNVASEQFTIDFLYPPRADVTVHISVSDPTRGEVSHETLVFTPFNHDVPQVVSSRALNRSSVLSGGYEVQFTTSSDDEVYDGLTDSWSFILPANAAPSIEITTPAEGANLPEGSDLSVSVNSNDPDGSVAHVTLWINDVLVRQDNAAPYQWSPAAGDSLLAELAEDVYRLRIEAVDNQGAAHTVTRTITVGDVAANPPAVPTGLVADSSFETVSLTWEANNQAQFKYYSVYRSNTSGVYGDPMVTGLTEIALTDAGLENDVAYFYVVTATDIFGNESASSAEVEGLPSIGGSVLLQVNFGSDYDGYGGFTTFKREALTTWTEEPNGIRYFSNAGDRNTASLLGQIDLDTSDENAYTIVGEIDGIAPGRLGRNNWIGLHLFGNGSLSGSGIGVRLINATELQILSGGAEGAVQASKSWLGNGHGDGLLIYQATVEFDGPDVHVSFTLTDAALNTDTLTATLPRSSLTLGNDFGVASWERANVDSPFAYEVRSLTLAEIEIIRPPEAPANLEANQVERDVVFLSWTGSDEPGVQYRVYRSTTSGEYSQTPHSSGIGSPQTFDDDAVTPGQTYYYVATAVNQAGIESAFSNEVSVVIVEDVPPFFNVNPILKPNAMVGVAYNDSIAADASEPDSNPMTFSKVSGPAWLDIAPDGLLSGTPGSADVGINNWVVQVSSVNGSTQATLEIIVDPDPDSQSAVFLFGSERDGFAGFTADGAAPLLPWIEQPHGIRYVNDGSQGTGFINSSLLRQIPLDRTPGAAYTFVGTVDISSMGPSSRPSRIGMNLFANSSSVSAVDSGIILMLSRDGNMRFHAFGINNFAEPGISAAYGGSVAGGGIYTYEVTVEFGEETAALEGTLTDHNGFWQSLSMTVPLDLITGDSFGFGTRSRRDGAPDFVVEPQSFSVIDLNAPDDSVTDTNDNGIDDAWETANFGHLLEADEIIHESGVPFYFLYLAGWQNGEPPGQAGRLGIEQAVNGTHPTVAWEFAEGFELGVHAEVWISTDLVDWAPLPSEHYSLNTDTTNGRTRHELEITHDYGYTVYLRLRKP